MYFRFPTCCSCYYQALSRLTLCLPNHSLKNMWKLQHVLMKHLGAAPPLFTRCCELMWHHISLGSARGERRWCHPLVSFPPLPARPMCCGASNQTNVGRLGQRNHTSTHSLRGSVLWRPGELRQTENLTLAKRTLFICYIHKIMFGSGEMASFYWICLQCLPPIHAAAVVFPELLMSWN